MSRKVAVESMTLSSRRRKVTVYEVSEEDEPFYLGVREILAELPETDDITILTLKGHLIIEPVYGAIAQRIAPYGIADNVRYRITHAASSFTQCVERGIYPYDLKCVGMASI